LEPAACFNDGSKKDESSSEISRYLTRFVKAELLRVVLREYCEEGARIYHAKVGGTVQRCREKVHHSFREVSEACLSPNIKGENREDPWIGESGRSRWLAFRLRWAREPRTARACAYCLDQSSGIDCRLEVIFQSDSPGELLVNAERARSVTSSVQQTKQAAKDVLIVGGEVEGPAPPVPRFSVVLTPLRGVRH